MIICPRCLTKIDKERYEAPSRCPHCKQTIENSNVIPTIPFLDCISGIQYVGLNTQEGAKRLLEMMK